jgi:hypothetical protein
MYAVTQELLRLADEQAARDRRRAQEARLATEARRRLRQPLRLRAARLLIRLGERLATEPIPTPARSA